MLHLKRRKKNSNNFPKYWWKPLHDGNSEFKNDENREKNT